MCSEYKDICYPSQKCKAWGTCEGPAYIKRRDADTAPASAAPADAKVRARRNTDGEERRDLDFTGYDDGRGQHYQSPYDNQRPPQPQPAPAPAPAFSGDDNGGDRRFPTGPHNYKYYDTGAGVYNNFAYGAPDRYGQHAGYAVLLGS